MKFSEWLEKQDDKDDNLVERAYNHRELENETQRNYIIQLQKTITKLNAPVKEYKGREITLYRNLIKHKEYITNNSYLETYSYNNWSSIKNCICKKGSNIVKTEEKQVEISEGSK